MAKKVVQLYDKYKSTTKVFPKIIDECFEESAINKIKTLAQGEVIDVEANPELAGTEAELGSIQIGDTKYKVGGGKQLYQHNITLLYATQYFMSCSFISDSADMINNATKLKEYLTANNFNGWNTCLMCSGTFKSGSTITPVVGICMFGTSLNVVHSLSGSNDPNYKQEAMSAPTSVSDNVITL